MAITYSPRTGRPFRIFVYLDGKRVGAIQQKGEGYFYRPRGAVGADEIFPTIAAVKASIEAV